MPAAAAAGAAAERTPTRDRILFAAAELFRRQGYTGTGVKQIVAEAEAPLGSLYHFYPGGKEQLAAEVIGTAGPFFVALVTASVEPEEDPVGWAEAFFRGAGETLAAGGYADACPISTMTMEIASSNERLRLAAAAAFTLWVDGIAAELRSRGVPADRCPELAESMLASLEGGFVLSRARRTTTALDAAGATAALAVRAALEA